MPIMPPFLTKRAASFKAALPSFPTKKSFQNKKSGPIWFFLLKLDTVSAIITL
jgi:hypothetical protein